MSAPPAAPTAAGRRLRFGAMAALLAVAATVSLVVANVLATRHAARIDVTATREHRLSPRSADLVARLAGRYEIVVAAPLRDPRTADPRALAPLRDVLGQFQRAAPDRITATLLDTGSADGLQAYDALLRRLAERDSEKIAQRAGSLERALAQTETIAGDMETLTRRLQAVRDAIPPDSPGGQTNRSYFDQRGAELVATAAALRDAVGKSRATLAAPAGPLPVPDLEAAAAPVRRLLSEIDAGLTDIAENGRRFAGAETVPATAREPAKEAGDAAAALRDRAAILHDLLEQMARIDLLRVARTLQTTTAALVVGPAGLTAIDLSRLLPTPATIDGGGGARADLARNAEDLLATALASLAQPVKPIVMFLHGQPVRALLQSPDFAGVLDRLALRGIDAAEWAVVLEAEPPPLTRADPAGRRPVVYVVLSTDASWSAGAKGQSGPERAGKLGAAAAELIRAGKPVLLCLNPSTLPTFGEPDPMVAGLGAFGLWADTGRPLLRERFTPEGRAVDAWQALTAADASHPIARAVRGLPTRFEWPIAIRTGSAPGKPAEPPSGSTITPLYVADDPAAWGESQWLSYWQVKIQDHPLVPNKPSKDARDDAPGPWTVAVAAELGGRRLVAVGSNTWFMDRLALARATIDGRATLTNPGNAELFEAAVYWLAGQDEMIGQGPSGRPPLIRPLGGGTLAALRWAAMMGLPGLALLAGALWRLWRG